MAREPTCHDDFFLFTDNQTEISAFDNQAPWNKRPFQVSVLTKVAALQFQANENDEENTGFSENNRAAAHAPFTFLCVRYHYYGIGIRETSQYYQSVYSGKGLTRYAFVVK